jgi:cytochrome c peroxidase
MKPARKLKYGTAILALGILAAFPPGVTEATPVDPAIMARFKKVAPFQQRLAALRNKLLIEKGRRLFMNETFKGNGRTCATCHPPTNNFTIDKEFIAQLHRRNPRDPLFVAEFKPALAQLENPALMHEFGLILENLDGFTNPGVMRGVPHTLGMTASLKIAPGDQDPARAAGGEATGWSGDGAPLPGSLRAFAVGAVMQHFPKTLARKEGKDFRLPTDAELDALEAFQLSLGRKTDLNLATLNFADPNVQAGKILFDSQNAGGKCSFCHGNAGANDPDGFNRNFDTNTESLTPADRPPDGGFGGATGGAGFGNQTFNVASLVEAADTPPFFHNNSAATIEDAVHFYTTSTFASTPFDFDAPKINQVAAFLRTINALENIRSSNELAKEAQSQLLQARQTIKERVIPDTEDAIEVLSNGPLDLYPTAVGLLERALQREEDASRTLLPLFRNALLRQAIELKEDARDLILALPPS